VVAAVAVPVGFALSLETKSGGIASPTGSPIAMTVTSPFSSAELTAARFEFPDAAKLLGLGTLLLALSAAVRKRT
jgi:hypothetical protein